MNAPNQTRYMSKDGVVATCSGCNASFTAETWQVLPLVGYMDYAEDGDQRVELRNCTCKEEHARFTRSALLAQKQHT
jgi:hypothetical protein